jgi:hypothetical protein
MDFDHGGYNQHAYSAYPDSYGGPPPRPGPGYPGAYGIGPYGAGAGPYAQADYGNAYGRGPVAAAPGYAGYPSQYGYAAAGEGPPTGPAAEPLAAAPWAAGNSRDPQPPRPPEPPPLPPSRPPPPPDAAPSPPDAPPPPPPSDAPPPENGQPEAPGAGSGEAGQAGDAGPRMSAAGEADEGGPAPAGTSVAPLVGSSLKKRAQPRAIVANAGFKIAAIKAVVVKGAPLSKAGAKAVAKDAGGAAGKLPACG